MARIRSVHPGIFTDEAWVSCQPLSRVLFIGLWTDADDQGLFEWKPLQIKMRLLPGDAADVANMLEELEAVDLVKSFTHNGKRFGAIRNFRKHQRPKKPNSVHHLPQEFRTYVAIDAAGSEPDADEDSPVPNQFPTSGENPPQMEDGGWRMGKEEVSEAIASSVAESDEEGEFAALWSAYPHVKGRSSKPKSKAAFTVIPKPTQSLLSAAAKRYASGGTIPPGGAPMLQKWLEDELWRDWLDAPKAQAAPSRWSGPADVRAAFATACGEDWCASYIDPSAWQDVPARALIAHSSFALGKITDVLRTMANHRPAALDGLTALPREVVAA